MKERISREELYISMAELMAKRSTCGRLNVGCIITRDGRIIATGYNGPIKKHKHCNEYNCEKDKPCTISIHAEANAISFAARNGVVLENSVMYITHAPCLKCAELMIQSGIKEVIYKEDFRTTDGIDLLIANTIYIQKYDGE